MKTARIAAAAMLLALASAAPSLAQSSFTGQQWRGWSSDAKIMYLVGWVDGWQHGLFEATKEFAPSLIATWPSDPRVAKFASTVTVGQLLEGVNKFYDDYRNLQIGIRTAIEVVDDESSGKGHWSEEDLIRLRAAEARPKPPTR